MKTKKDKSAFLEQFGDTPQLRVLDFLIGEFYFDFPLTEIARKSEISYNSLKSFFPRLVEKCLVIKTRRIGKSDYYKLNEKNIIVKQLLNLALKLIEQDLGIYPESTITNNPKPRGLVLAE